MTGPVATAINALFLPARVAGANKQDGAVRATARFGMSCHFSRLARAAARRGKGC